MNSTSSAATRPGRPRLGRCISKTIAGAAALLLATLAVPAAFGYGTPEISLDASALPTGALTSWTNTGNQGGSFGNDGTTVNVATVGGKNSVTFTGANWMKASFAAPATMTGSHAYSLVALVYNPGIGGEEAYLTGAHRGAGSRCAQFNYGNAAAYGAITHFSADMGFVGFTGTAPSASAWHWIAVTYDGTTEKLYVDGTLNNSAARALNLWTGEPVFLGTSFGAADGTGKGQGFSGSMAALQVYGETLTAADVKSLSGAAFITGTVTSGGNPVSGATVYYKLSANASVSPIGSVTTDASGNYTIGVLQNSGSYYIAAGKTGYLTTSDYSPAPLVTTSDVTGINFSLTAQNTISGNVSDGANLYRAAVSISTNPDGSSPSQTVLTDASGNYLAYVNQNTTYYLIAKKSAHANSSVLSVPVTSANVTGKNFTLTKNTVAKLVEVDVTAATAGTGVVTSGAPLSNTGTLGGTFGPQSQALNIVNIGARNGVQFDGTANCFLKSSWTTSATANWPSAIAGSDIQYTTVAWIYESTTQTGDTYLSWNGNSPQQSAMWFNYDNRQWGSVDHGTGVYMGWGTQVYPAVGAWHMIAVTYDGSNEKNYYDLSSTITLCGNATNRVLTPNAGVNMRIGSDDGGGTRLVGYVNKIQVYDQPLSQSELQALWTAGNAANYTISGTVSASGGGGLASATVTVYSDADCTSVVTSTTADGGGNYTTIGVPQNTTYYLKAGKTGYVTSGALSVALATSNLTGKNLTLSLIPSATVSGQVTDSVSGSPIAGAKVYISSGANASVAASTVLTTDGSGNYSTSVDGGTWYVCASDATHKTSADITITNSDGLAQSGKNIALVADSANNIPQKQSLLFGVVDDSLPVTQGADTGNWPVYHPLGASALTKMGSPTVDMLNSKVFAMNHNGTTADGFKFMNLPQGNSIAMNGASIVTVIKPIRTGTTNNYQPVVSVLLGQLELCVRNGDGIIQVGRKGTDAPNNTSTVAIPDGQKTILTLVVQPTGQFKVYLNGVESWNVTSTADMTSITPQTWYATDISIGKGWNGDAWSSFNGDVADTLVYKAALSDADRVALETNLGTKFGVAMPVYRTISATAGAHGTISPSGTSMVADGSSPTYVITPDSGYVIDTLTVDGVIQIATLNHTFPTVAANHSLSVTFKVDSNPTQLAYLRFDESSGTVAADSSNHGNVGTVAGSGSWTPGLINNAVSLNGSNTYLTLPNDLMSTVNDFTISAWVKLNANNVFNRVFDFGSGTGKYMFLSPQGAGTVRYAITSGSGEQVINGTAPLPTGSWQHVTVTLAGTTGTLYVNGVQVGQNTGMTLKPSSLGATTQNFIGKSQWPDPYFNGLIDDFRIYNRALSSAEIGSELGVYSLAASAGANGTISPNGIVATTQSGSQSYTITANAGYVINQILVDGVNNPAAVAAGSHVFSNVTANHTISASFQTTYQAWLAQNGNLADTPANFLAYAFGTAPGATGPAGYAPGPPAVVTPGQPTISVTTSATSVDFRAVFSRRHNYATEGLSYTLQFSPADLNFSDGNRKDTAVGVPDGTNIILLGTDGINDVVSVPYPWLIPTTRGYEKPTFFRVMVNSTVPETPSSP